MTTLNSKTREKIFNSLPPLPPRRLLLQMLESACWCLAELITGRAKISEAHMINKIEGLLNSSTTIIKTMAKPEMQELLDKDDIKAVKDMIKDIDTEAFVDMMSDFANHLKDKDKLDDEEVKQSIEIFSRMRDDDNFPE